MARDLVPATPNLPASEFQTESFGVYAKKSGMCPVCNHPEHMAINLSRARDHNKLTDIAREFSIGRGLLVRHFENHFIVDSRNQQIINLLENDSSESKEIVTRIFEGGVDLLEGSRDVLKSKSMRLHELNRRRHVLSDRQETEALDDIETQELVQIHRLTQDIEDSITKTYVLLHKQLFPFGTDDTVRAVTTYKLTVLRKMLDQVQFTLVEFEHRGPEFKHMIQEMRRALAKRFNDLEEDVLKSGGLLVSSGNSGNGTDN